MIRLTFLGSGTSGGVPVISCDCAVCRSLNPKNKRLRSSVLFQVNDLHILVDTSPDLRQQLLRQPIPRVDAVLYTHAHADHIFGLDELRRFNYLQKERIAAYAHPETSIKLRSIFDYAFHQGALRPGVPNLSLQDIEGKFNIAETEIIPIPLLHGGQEILGFRIGNMAYCTDVSGIPDASYKLLENLDILVLGALREKPHPTHFSLGQAIEQAQKINAKQTYFTHISHILNHDKHGKDLPDSCTFAYDGLVLESVDTTKVPKSVETSILS